MPAMRHVARDMLIATTMAFRSTTAATATQTTTARPLTTTGISERGAAGTAGGESCESGWGTVQRMPWMMLTSSSRW
jgi:hypothetical protein